MNATPLRLGMIGLDTSHVIHFARVFNDPDSADDLADCRIVAGFPGGSDIPLSRDRVDEFTAQLSESGVEIVGNIPALLERVDGVLLESLDGRVHLEQALPVFAAGKPMFIDKPLAGSLRDAVVIAELAQQSGVTCWSSSAMRFCPTVRRMADDQSSGAITGCAVWGPCEYQPGIPDLFFYGIHGIEALSTLMGPGCSTVQRRQTRHCDLVSCVWDDGRLGTYRGLRENAAACGATFGATVFRTDGVTVADQFDDYADSYRALCVDIARFFTHGQSPVAMEQTLEIYALMEAADESRRDSSAVINVRDVLDTATQQARDVLTRIESDGSL